MSRTLLAGFTVKPGYEDRVARLPADFAEKVRSEPGNLVLDVCTEESDPRAYRIFEVHRDEAAFAEHIAAPCGGPFDAGPGGS